MLDFTDYVADLRALVDEHHLGEGRYARWSTRCGGAEPAVNPYGCADAVNILYTLGELPSSEAARREHIAALRDLQDPDSGSFDEPTHRREHTTAHVVAALELFDARPAHRLHFLEPLLDRDALERYLDALDWSRPWPASHGGAGVAAALFLTGRVSHTWLSWYFDWLDAHVDPGTGLWRRGRMLELDEDPGRFANLGASFHYHFNYLSFRRAIPHPERVVDSCLQILREGAVRIGLDDVTFKEVDWAYCAHRSLRQSGHRRTEVTAGLRELAGRLYTRLNSPEYRASRTYDDLHLAFGALCAVAELQLALPGEIRTPRPLRLVLDRRPFI